MGKCNAGDCGISCEGECICFASTENPSDCECFCDAPPIVVSAFRRYAANPEALIDMMAADMPLIRVAQWFEYLFPEQILVPVAKLQTRVTTSFTGIRVNDLIKHVGLVPSNETLVGREFSD